MWYSYNAGKFSAEIQPFLFRSYLEWNKEHLAGEFFGIQTSYWIPAIRTSPDRQFII